MTELRQVVSVTCKCVCVFVCARACYNHYDTLNIVAADVSCYKLMTYNALTSNKRIYFRNIFVNRYMHQPCSCHVTHSRQWHLNALQHVEEFIFSPRISRYTVYTYVYSVTPCSCLSACSRSGAWSLVVLKLIKHGGLYIQSITGKRTPCLAVR